MMDQIIPAIQNIMIITVAPAKVNGARQSSPTSSDCKNLNTYILYNLLLFEIISNKNNSNKYFFFFQYIKPSKKFIPPHTNININIFYIFF